MPSQLKNWLVLIIKFDFVLHCQWIGIKIYRLVNKNWGSQWVSEWVSERDRQKKQRVFFLLFLFFFLPLSLSDSLAPLFCFYGSTNWILFPLLLCFNKVYLQVHWSPSTWVFACTFTFVFAFLMLIYANNCYHLYIIKFQPKLLIHGHQKNIWKTGPQNSSSRREKERERERKKNVSYLLWQVKMFTLFHKVNWTCFVQYTCVTVIHLHDSHDFIKITIKCQSI